MYEDGRRSSRIGKVMEKGGMKGYKRVGNRFPNWFRVEMALRKEGFVGIQCFNFS
jgi:hypothetical protein